VANREKVRRRRERGGEKERETVDGWEGGGRGCWRREEKDVGEERAYRRFSNEMRKGIQVARWRKRDRERKRGKVKFILSFAQA
jgi:hypothetical protein